MKIITTLTLLILIYSTLFGFGQIIENIPLPEHPRPDFQREKWLNLNGLWDFNFDPQNVGEKEKWFSQTSGYDKKILVPFPWGSKLSGVKNEAEMAWYARQIEIPADWDGQRVFVIFGASDWITTAWLDGQSIGTFQGGYTPFEFEITPFIKKGQNQQLTVRVEDTPFPFKLEGKQGYGQAKGIWQTVYLEARGPSFIKSLHFTPDIDQQKIIVRAVLDQPAPSNTLFKIKFLNGDQSKPEVLQKIKKGQSEITMLVPIEKMHLWDLDDPFLYDMEASVLVKDNEIDRLKSYFGMRKLSVMPFPGLNHPYIALNNKPLYLQITLDQSYHPDGFYTFPSDEFMKGEILRSKRIGLNANRIHIKVEIPRKLYWADKLGLLIMADVPNFWGDPTPEAQEESEIALRGMFERDYNHPCIFQWVLFNETWGLFTDKYGPDKKRLYAPETQTWVESMYKLAKQLDPTRLVEDNSPCNNDHVATDVNSWHVYIPGYEWKKHLDEVCANTFPTSKWNFIGGRVQGNQPLINSECGNVWGYDGSTGDVDWTWDYHLMMNEFRSHPKVCGWLYTEHHDVINEWNGYYRFERTEKFTGLDGIVPGMSINDFHSEIYIALSGPLCREVKPFDNVQVPLFASFMTSKDFGTNLTLKTELSGYDQLGNYKSYSRSTQSIPYQPWLAKELQALNIQIPAKRGLAVLAISVEDASGNVLHRNFTTFYIGEGESGRQESVSIDGKNMKLVRFAPNTFKSQSWSQKQWNVLDGLKVNGAGYGHFEYEVTIPEGVTIENIDEITLVAELSAKQLFGKDRPGATNADGDYMLGKGNNDPSQNPNSYPMTDNYKYPSVVRIKVNGEAAGTFFLEDDPADHRGILSWFSQPQNRKLSEAGSYGYLVKATIPKYTLQKSVNKTLTVRFEVDTSFPGGLAIYGERFGRYPVDPTLIFVMKK